MVSLVKIFLIVYFVPCPYSLSEEIIWPIYIVERMSRQYLVRQYLVVVRLLFSFLFGHFLDTLCGHGLHPLFLLGIYSIAITLISYKKVIFFLHTTQSITAFPSSKDRKQYESY